MPDGEITLRDLWQEQQDTRRDLTGAINSLRDTLNERNEADRAYCDTRMSGVDDTLQEHEVRLNRLDLYILFCVGVTLVGVGMWFAHLAGFVPW